MGYYDNPTIGDEYIVKGTDKLGVLIAFKSR